MENIPEQGSKELSSQPQISNEQVDLTIKPRANLIVVILLTTILNAVVFGTGGYYLAKTKYLSKQSTVEQQLATPTSASDVSTSLTKYTSTTEKLSFEYPSDWISSDEYTKSNFPEGDSFGIEDPSGTVHVSWTAAIDGVGGGCDIDIPLGQSPSACPLYEVVEKKLLPETGLYYVSYLMTRDGINYEPMFALQDSNGFLETKRAIAFMLFEGKYNGGVHAELYGHGPEFDSKSKAQAFFSTNEYTQARNILLSASY